MKTQLSGKNKLVVIYLIAIVMQLAFPAAQSNAQLRKIKVGDKMPEFSLPEDKKGIFTYQHKRKAMVLIFLSEQKQSKLAIAGIEEILNKYEEKRQLFDFVAVVNDPNNSHLLEYLQIRSRPNYHVLIDEKFKLWGKIGLIAMPTTLISDKDGNVTWIKAGYGYDFVPAVKQNLGKALGINNEPNQSSIEVKTLVHDTMRARVMRHLQMARMLEKKGRTKSAEKEVKKAFDLDPNSISAALAMGKIYCKSGKAEDAVNVVVRLEPEIKSEKAEMNLILGWANRQLNNLERSEKFLLEAVSLNPGSPRSFYELGKTLEAKGDIEKAMKAYHKALTKIFTDPD